MRCENQRIRQTMATVSLKRCCQPRTTDINEERKGRLMETSLEFALHSYYTCRICIPVRSRSTYVDFPTRVVVQ